jgi:E3 ubiquitin-protein ligase RAD18
VQEILDAFKNARESALTLAKKEAARIAAGDNEAPEPVPKKRKVSQVDHTEAIEVVQRSPQRVRTRSRSQMALAQASRQERIQAAGVPEVIEDSQDEDFVPGRSHIDHLWSPLSLTLTIVADDGMVACPICNRRMKNEAVFSHLDKCTGDPEPATNPAPAKQTSFGYGRPIPW